MSAFSRKAAASKWGASAAARFKADPFSAAWDISASLSEAEAVARAVGMDASRRESARIAWNVRIAMTKGHTMIPWPAPVATKHDIVALEGSFATTRNAYEIDAFVASELASRSRDVPPPVSLNSEEFGDLDDEQLEAAKRVLTSGISILTGPPGCGKSFILRAIVAAVGGPSAS